MISCVPDFTVTRNAGRVSDFPALEMGPEFVQNAGKTSLQRFWEMVPSVAIAEQSPASGAEDEIQYFKGVFAGFRYAWCDKAL